MGNNTSTADQSTSKIKIQNQKKIAQFLAV